MIDPSELTRGEYEDYERTMLEPDSDRDRQRDIAALAADGPARIIPDREPYLTIASVVEYAERRGWTVKSYDPECVIVEHPNGGDVSIGYQSGVYTVVDTVNRDWYASYDYVDPEIAGDVATDLIAAYAALPDREGDKRTR